MPLLYSEATSYSTAAFFALSLSRANLATTRPWNGSMKQARNTYFFDLPVRACSVALGLVDHGVISTVLALSAISEAGIA